VGNDAQGQMTDNHKKCKIKHKKKNKPIENERKIKEEAQDTTKAQSRDNKQAKQKLQDEDSVRKQMPRQAEVEWQGKKKRKTRKTHSKERGVVWANRHSLPNDHKKRKWVAGIGHWFDKGWGVNRRAT